MGPYLCIASNGVPPTVSKRIVLIVHFAPMVWIENQLVGAYEGQTLMLECHSEAYPRPITYWTKSSNETIVSDANYLVETTPMGYESTMKLTIKSVRAQDFGSFKCVATNSLGKTDGKIKVYKLPKPPSTGVPNSRRNSKKSWNHDHGNDKKTSEMTDDMVLNESEDDEDTMDFQSATSSSSIHRRLVVLQALLIVFASLVERQLSTT